MLQLQPGQHIHFIGIGGAGLSAIARILLQRGFRVSGSDLNQSAVTTALAADGARIYQGHKAAQVLGADIVLASSAIPPGHIELAAAAAAGIPVYKRESFIGAVLRGYDTIAVAGAHGKTTTTSMIIHILQCAGLDPSFIVGGLMGNSGLNAALGGGDSFVIEADEYDNMFHGLAPDLAVITNVEHDHPDFFETAKQMEAAFDKFVGLLGADGTLVACADDEVARGLARSRNETGGRAINYGIRNLDADWLASDLRFSSGETVGRILQGGLPRTELRLQVPGRHNVLNALAAMIVAAERGVSPEQSSAALRSFKATARRFEVRGERDGVILVDDYAHHPTEIKANIEAARLRYPRHQIWAIWQPHTYSRVRQFWCSFLGAFAGADRVLVTPIYAAREQPLEGVNSAALVQEMDQTSQPSYAPTFDQVVETLRRCAKDPAVALIFSAGDANQIADMFLNGEA